MATPGTTSATTGERPVRLAVLGSPIAHSKSPALHRSAYDRLGLEWRYDAIEVRSGELGAFLARVRGDADAAWRGLSLTMPLKHEVLEHLDGADRLVDLAGAANTVRFADDGSLQGFNTDIGGIVRTLGEADLRRVHRGVLIGGGATASSALVALAELGAAEVDVLVRNPDRAVGVQDLGRRLGLVVRVRPLSELADVASADLVVSTAPGGSDLGVVPSDELAGAALLLDVAYDPWPSTLATAWLERDGRVTHGLGMLLHQALLQVRIFASGDPFEPLPDEARVLDVMRRSL
ncbi:shikimate 5-dehydrogenase [Agromyces luteolus]|uniref:Shikimate dehydrogenase n=1 Tax=Agromyces luteolus TaxID=88373 RepID=A0A7C9HSF1_9MICO|nr:shikimate dehydrogenase [Agromyces luteolus]MUN08369.1 shikimate dehydrogenase [Agromyces luteolus]GLK26901.1 shikimate 5-dehydrogenase [Agromyces luteolus]